MCVVIARTVERKRDRKKDRRRGGSKRHTEGKRMCVILYIKVCGCGCAKCIIRIRDGQCWESCEK